jgi:LysM repeat protein
VAVIIIRNAVTGQHFSGVVGKRMYIHAEATGTLVFSVPYAPREIAYDGLAHDWAEAERSGNKPLLLYKSTPLQTMKFSVALADPDRLFSQTGSYAAVRALAATKERVLVRYGPTEAGLWRITDCSVSSVQRHPDTNEITEAVVSFSFTEASDAAPAVGPVMPPPPPPPPPPPAAPPARTYTVVRTDCLWKIAQRFYGNGALWPRIFDANRNQIKNPNLIYPGQVFVIP